MSGDIDKALANTLPMDAWKIWPEICAVVRAAAIHKSHNDTCSQILLREGPCDCGHTARREALAALAAKVGTP